MLANEQAQWSPVRISLVRHAQSCLIKSVRAITDGADVCVISGLAEYVCISRLIWVMFPGLLDSLSPMLELEYICEDESEDVLCIELLFTYVTLTWTTR